MSTYLQSLYISLMRKHTFQFLCFKISFGICIFCNILQDLSTSFIRLTSLLFFSNSPLTFCIESREIKEAFIIFGRKREHEKRQKFQGRVIIINSQVVRYIELWGVCVCVEGVIEGIVLLTKCTVLSLSDLIYYELVQGKPHYGNGHSKIRTKSQIK